MVPLAPANDALASAFSVSEPPVTFAPSIPMLAPNVRLLALTLIDPSSWFSRTKAASDGLRLGVNRTPNVRPSLTVVVKATLPVKEMLAAAAPPDRLIGALPMTVAVRARLNAS